MKLKNKFKKYIHVNLQEYIKIYLRKIIQNIYGRQRNRIKPMKRHFIFLEKKTQIS